MVSLEIQKSLCKPGPDLVVCDEGHRIKNNQANVSQALKKIQTRYSAHKIYTHKISCMPIGIN